MTGKEHGAKQGGTVPAGEVVARLLTAVECVVEAGKALAVGFPPGHERTLEPIKWAHSVLGELVRAMSPKPVVRKAAPVKRTRRKKAGTKGTAPRTAS